MMNNIQKLFSERVEIFGAVEFSLSSILTGIVKIALKTLIECVRLRTFSKHGLQQVQVDAQYLSTHLWRHVNDEALLNSLLDEVVNSTVGRCINPVLMEVSVVEAICRRADKPDDA